MPLPLTIPPRQTHKSLLNAPVVTDLDAIDARIAFLGIPSGDPYSIDEVQRSDHRSDCRPGKRPAAFAAVSSVSTSVSAARSSMVGTSRWWIKGL